MIPPPLVFPGLVILDVYGRNDGLPPKSEFGSITTWIKFSLKYCVGQIWRHDTQRNDSKLNDIYLNGIQHHNTLDHRHLINIDYLTVCTACLVCFINTVNSRSKRKRKEAY